MTPTEIAALSEDQLNVAIDKYVNLRLERFTESWSSTMQLLWKYSIGCGSSNVAGTYVCWTTQKLEEEWRELAFPTATTLQELRVAICRLALVCALMEKKGNVEYQR